MPVAAMARLSLCGFCKAWAFLSVRFFCDPDLTMLRCDVMNERRSLNFKR